MKWLVIAALLVSAAASAGEARPFGRGTWQEIRARYEGQPMVVHLWGLTCAPCLDELPRWTQLQNSFPEMNFVFIAADPAPMPTDEVNAMLKKHGLTQVDSWNFADRFTARLRFEIEPTWKGELPRTLLIEKDGHITAMPGVANIEDVKAWVKAR